MNDVTGGYLDDRTEDERARHLRIATAIERYADDPGARIEHAWTPAGWKFMAIKDEQGNVLWRDEEGQP